MLRLVGLIILAAFSPLSANAQPSFNCGKAVTPTEIAICSSARLAQLDLALSSLYSAARARLTSQDQQQLLSDQRSWLARRDACQADAVCLAEAMEARLSELGRVANTGKLLARESADSFQSEPAMQLPSFNAPTETNTAGNNSSGDSIPAGVWSAQFSCHLRGNATEQFAARLLTLDAHGDQAFFQLAAIDGSDDNRPQYAVLDASERVEPAGVKYEYIYDRLIDARFDFVIRKISDDRLSVDFVHCENVLFEREAADITEPAFLGSWTGALEACSRSTGDLDLTLAKAHQGNVFADVDYKIPYGTSGEMLPGRAYLYGTWNATENEYTFSTIVSGRAARNGDDGYNWSGLKGLKLGYDESTENLIGSSEECSYAELSRDGGETSSGAPELSSAENIQGTWEGEAICSRGDTFFALKIPEAQSGRIAGMLDIAGPDSLMRGVSSLDVQLRESSTQGEFEGAVEWAGAPLKSFTIASDDHADMINLVEDDLGCGDVELSRVDETALSRVPTAQVTGGGSFFANRRPQDRCEAIITLPKKFEREFPDVSMLKSPSEKVYPKLVLLYADDDWVPVFGKPFDTTPLSERREIRNEARQLCYDDPFYSDDYYKFSTLDRGLTGNMKRPLTSFGLPAIHIAIRQIRETRHQLDQQVEEALASTEVADAAAKARTTSAFMKNNDERLWPSEIEAKDKQLSDHVAALALQNVEAELTRSDDTSNPAQRLAALTDIAKGEQGYHRYLDERNMADLERRATERQSQLAQRVLSDDLAEIENLTQDRNGLISLEEKASELDATLSLLVDKVAEPFSARIETKRQSILEALFERNISALRALEPGPAGLESSLAWLEAFKALFTPYQNVIAFEKAMNEFADKRESLLEGSLQQFEVDVEQAATTGGEEEVNKVVEKYLSWDGDEEIPVWLDYQLVAEFYK